MSKIMEYIYPIRSSPSDNTAVPAVGVMGDHLPRTALRRERQKNEIKNRKDRKKMKKEDSKAKVYGQNERIWYLCIPYYFLRSPTMSQLETFMGDKGLLIYMRLLFLATESQGILRLDNAEEETFFGRYLDNDNAPRSPITSIVSALGNKYSEQDIMKTLHILERCGAIKVLAEEQLRFRDVYEMGVERQRRAAEKRAQKGRIMFDGDGDGLEEPEEPEEAPEMIEEQPEDSRH